MYNHNSGKPAIDMAYAGTWPCTIYFIDAGKD